MKDVSLQQAVQQALQQARANGILGVPVPRMGEILGVGLSTSWNLVTQPDPDRTDPGDLRPPIQSITIGRRRIALLDSIVAFVERKRSDQFRKVATPPPGKGRKPSPKP